MKKNSCNNRGLGRRILSMVLAFAMTVTMSSVSRVGDVVMAAETDTSGVSSPKSSMYPTDRVQLKIGEQTYDMATYYGGVYEYPVELEAGTYTAKVLVNGEEKFSSKEVTVTEKTTVYFRANDGGGKDSVNDGIIHTAYFVGTLEPIGLSGWNPADENATLSYVGGGLYKRTFTFTALEEAKEIEYKVAFDGGWDYSIGDAGNNVKVTLPAGSTSITVLCDEANGKAYASTTDKFDKDISLIGTVRTSDEWIPETEGYEFHMVTPDVYVYTMSLKAGTYGYKCVYNHTGDWYAQDGNIDITLTEDSFVTFIYDASAKKLYDSVNDNEAVANFLSMTSTPAGGKVIANANGTTIFQMTAETGKTVKLFYGANGTGSKLQEATLSETKNGVYVTEPIFLGDDAVDIVYYYDVEGKRVLDSSQETITIGETEYSNYKRDAFTGRGVNVPGTFPGPSWDAASNKMSYSGNGLYSYTFKNVAAANYEYKISMGSWSENYGVAGKADGSNYSVSVPDTQDITVYYNDFTHLSVTSLNYVFSEVSLQGAGEAAKLEDAGLTGTYSAKVNLAAGTYDGVKMSVKTGEEEKEYDFDAFTLSEAKAVTFYFAPMYGIYYHDADSWSADESKISYDSKSADSKSIYGAVPTGTEVKFTIATGEDITKAAMIIKKNSAENKPMQKDGASANGIQKWSVTVSFDEIGEYQYFFAVYNKASVKFYADDDGYYGTGKLASLTEVIPYDLVVYKKDYKTPDWLKNAVIYQIFPDRFYNGDKSNDKAQTVARGDTNYEFVDWNLLPENPEQEDLLSADAYKATGAYTGDKIWNNEIYGGDLKGITEKIDYLEALGVNVIYLNPVFASISSHRYDTSDYGKIDPILGTLGDFTELSQIAKKHNMHIVLDGVFNHVSDDSVYFDRYYKYLEAGTKKIGAYPYWAYVYDYMAENQCGQAEAETKAKEYFKTTYGIEDFSYTEWFEVYNKALLDDKEAEVKDTVGLRKGKAVYGYEGWWGYDNMPVIKSTGGSEFQSGTWGKEIIEGSNSIGQYWISKGSDGWRLDVANEVSDETWQHFRSSVKSLNNGDAVIIGEIWDDATEYLLGDMYDSVMNYVFRGAVTGFAKGDSAQNAMNTLEKLRERYPQEAFYAMMNLVGSHDTTRLLSYLDGIDDDRKQNAVESAFPTYEKTSDTAKKRQYLVAFLQFTYAGAPTIYYGDEIGMVGADDPDDRRAFTWGKGNKELVTWYATLAAIRSQYAALRTGSVEPVDTKDENILSFVRRDKDDTLLVLANNAEQAKEVTLTLADINISGDTWTDLAGNKKYTATDGKIMVRVPAYSGAILTTTPKKITVEQNNLRAAYEDVSKETETPSKPNTTVVTTDTTNPAKVTGVSVKSSKTKQITVKWKKVSGTVTGYEVRYSTSSKFKGAKIVTVKGASKTSVTLKKLKAMTKYYVSVRAYRTSGKTNSYGSWSAVKNVTVIPATVTLKKVKSTKSKKASVTWKKTASVTGYEIQYSTSSKFKSAKKITVKGAAKTSATLKKLKSGKKYYVRIRAYKTASGKKVCGTWSSSKKVTVKK